MLSAIERRQLGSSELSVSRLALGSWRTFERIGRDAGEAVMRAARASGINFLDDARYNDETGTAPIPTGYSEVLFGELFRAVGWDRDDTIVANKLWWEFWPQQSAREELDASLKRMGFEYVDVIYATPPPDALSAADVVTSVGELISAGKARAWGIVNWDACQLLEASNAASAHGVPQPCAAQLPYSLVRREWVESPAMADALAATGASVVGSFVLAGGVLTGKYGAPAVSVGRVNRFGGERCSPARERGGRRVAGPGRPFRGLCRRARTGELPAQPGVARRATFAACMRSAGGRSRAARQGRAQRAAQRRPLTARRAELQPSRFQRTPCERPDKPYRQQRRASVARSSAHLTHGNNTSAANMTAGNLAVRRRRSTIRGFFRLAPGADCARWRRCTARPRRRSRSRSRWPTRRSSPCCSARPRLTK